MAFTSTKMGLRIWNLLTDLYDHSQLADNWAKVDYHDHSPGKGVQIPTEGIADAAVTGPKLASAVDPSAAYTSSKTLARTGASLATAAAAGTYMLRTDFGAVTATPGAATAAIYLDPTLWAAAGRTVRYVLRGGVITNAVAPTASYVLALYPVATWGGASGANPTVATLGTVVANSTTPSIAAPGASAASALVSAEFDAPVAGWYVAAVVQTGAAAAGANTNVISSLFVRQI